MKLKFPDNLVVGFQYRNDSMDSKLGYVVYREKNKLRKELSFNNWRNKDIPIEEISNKPKSGFLISKSIRRHAYHFGSGRSMMRLYDPDGFDIEVSIDNLEYILTNCNLNKGEIEGEFIYAWDGKELLLVPVESELYRDTVALKKDMNSKVKASELKVGAIYKDKKWDTTYTYLGRHDYYRQYMEKELISERKEKHPNKKYYSNYISRNDAIRAGDAVKTPKKQHIFVDNDTGNFIANATSKLAYEISPEDDRYPDFLEDFKTSERGSSVNKIGFREISEKSINKIEEKLKRMINNDYTEESMYIHIAGKYYLSFNVNFSSNIYYFKTNSIVELDLENKRIVNSYITDEIKAKNYNQFKRSYGFNNLSYMSKNDKEKLYEKFLVSIDDFIKEFEEPNVHVDILEQTEFWKLGVKLERNDLFETLIYKKLGLKKDENDEYMVENHGKDFKKHNLKKFTSLIHKLKPKEIYIDYLNQKIK